MFSQLKAAAVAATALLLLVVGLISTSLAAGAASGPRRVGAAPGVPRGAVADGAVSASRSLSVDIALEPSDSAALAAYATAVSTPGSADYKQYLTVSEFRQRFGPSQASIDTVESALKADGLTPGAVSANGLLIPVTATASQLGSAFSTSFENVTLPGGRVAFENTRAPQFSADAAGLVQGVVGLDNLATMHASAIHATPRTETTRLRNHPLTETAHAVGAPTDCSSADPFANADEGVTPQQAATIYGLSSEWSANDFGAGQTVGLVEYEEYATSDVTAYDTCFGISPKVTELNVDGGPTADPSYTDGSYGAGEAILDIQQIAGLAPGANIDVYEAPNNSEKAALDMYTDLADNSAIKVISTSWGECEQDETLADAKSEDTVWEQDATEGKSVYAAAGDAGSDDCETGSTAVDFPGVSPWVTSVGGTTLAYNDQPTGQTVWNDSSEESGAGGGGVSDFFTMPTYQSGAPASLNVVNSASSKTICATNTGSTGAYCREVPDVSADADPDTGYIGYYEGSWGVTGGTSAAAPLWAALTALANASSSCSADPVGFANPVIYDVADNATKYASDFFDVISGNNDYTQYGYNGGLYSAGTGYDMATGLGTPNAATLIPDMCSAAAAATATSSTTTTSASTTTTTPTTSTPSTTTSTPSTTSTTTTTAITKSTTTAAAPVPATPVVVILTPALGATAAQVVVGCGGNTGTCSVQASLTVVETLKRGRVVAIAAIVTRGHSSTVKSTKRTVTVGSARLSLAAGARGVLTIKLNGTGRTLLAGYRSLRSVLKLNLGGQRTVAKTLTFKVKAKR